MDPRLEGKKIYILTAPCDSRLGTVAAISTFLASRHGFIVDMHQFDDVISGRFFVRTVFFGDNHKSPDVHGWREQFMEVARREQMEWAIYEEDKPARVLVMVSKFDHCLVDLLGSWARGEMPMRLVAVVSNHEDLAGIAQQHGCGR